MGEIERRKRRARCIPFKQDYLSIIARPSTASSSLAQSSKQADDVSNTAEKKKEAEQKMKEVNIPTTFVPIEPQNQKVITSKIKPILPSTPTSRICVFSVENDSKEKKITDEPTSLRILPSKNENIPTFKDLKIPISSKLEEKQRELEAMVNEIRTKNKGVTVFYKEKEHSFRRNAYHIAIAYIIQSQNKQYSSNTVNFEHELV